MSTSRTHLATLKKVREARRNRERQALAEAFYAEQVLTARREELMLEQGALRDLQRSATIGPYVDVNRRLEAQRYELVLKARDTELTGLQAALAVETERRRQVLVEAERDVRVLELLDERYRREERRREQRNEAKQLDEAALQRHAAGSMMAW